MNQDFMKALWAAAEKLRSSKLSQKFLPLVNLGRSLWDTLQVRPRMIAKALLKGYEYTSGWLKTPWSIQTVVRRDEGEWRAFNRYRNGLSLSRLKRELLFAGEHPVRFSLSLLTLLIVILALGHVLPSGSFIPSWASWQASEQLAHFSTLWSVQATLAALVYPIVIAFVTVFLQRRPVAEAFVHLYILDSGALAAGLSSLALVVVMAVQYALLPFFGTSSLPTWVALDAVWFLVNATLTTYFLFRTVEFLRPEVQLNVVRRYAVNIALPRDVMRLNSFQVLAQAQAKGWITAPSYVDDEAPDGPKVFLSRFGFREGDVQGMLYLSEPARLTNVRLWFLRLVVASWMHEARKRPRQEDNHPVRQKDWPLLTIPMTPGTEYRESTPLARVDSGPHLVGWQRMLLRLAFVFQPIRRERSGIRVKSILDELEADAREAAGKPDEGAFERAYKTLVSLHELLLGASLTRSDDGTLGSWALLPDIESFAERALHLGWADSYRSIFLAAIGAMVSDTRPIRRLCHLVQHLEGDDLRLSPLAIRENVLQLPPLMMYQLSGWWVKRAEEQGVMEHGHHRMVVLRAPVHRVYEEVISTFVAGWENARTAVARVPDASEAFEWASAPTLGRLNATHIQETARMLLAAVARGDSAAAEWLADVLSKWWGAFAYEHEPIALYGKTKYLTLGHLKLDWPTLSSLMGLTEQDIQWGGGNLRGLQRGALVAALQNFWTDIRLLVLELLLSWAEQDGSATLNESLAMEIAVGMLTGKQWRGGGTLAKPMSGFTAAAYLEAKVRQYAADGEWQSGYVGQLSRFVERIKDMERPDMVSSRVYSFSGADDVASLQEQQLVLLAAFSATEWTASESLRRQVDIWISRQYGSVDILRQKSKDWLQRLDQAHEPSPKVLYEILMRTGKAHDAVQGRARAKHGIESLRDLVESKWADVLAAAPVDPERLKQLAQYASNKGFQSASGEFPLQLFGAVQFGAEELQDFTLTMKQVRKGELTRTEMDQHAANEEEYWADTMARQVGVVVLTDVLVGCKTRDICVPDAEAYWVALKAEAARLAARGERPILVLDNATRPEWVWQWQHADFGQEYVRPNDLRVQRFDGRGDGYLCNFNDIEVFVAPLQPGKSILLARETFKAVTFREFEQGRFVDTTFEERDDSKLLVDLKLKFSRRVDVGSNEVARLDYASDQKQPV
ncbi:hypothetical protein RA280_14805 [Cupriavidus sp. CV2]|uniref:hypothetical protein n=1 Tax=Cupriavidus ulmosensis TaxID=3065913 RepID=UPI00296B1B2F|nr:hypothetical protein [Cupriavidus sp. CV2]MDW3682995.1 hypothetical protein [Cupriavidus sp. CV2]